MDTDDHEEKGYIHGMSSCGGREAGGSLEIELEKGDESIKVVSGQGET